jgi:hypothetical protein
LFPPDDVPPNRKTSPFTVMNKRGFDEKDPKEKIRHWRRKRNTLWLFIEASRTLIMLTNVVIGSSFPQKRFLSFGVIDANPDFIK